MNSIIKLKSLFNLEDLIQLIFSLSYAYTKIVLFCCTYLIFYNVSRCINKFLELKTFAWLTLTQATSGLFINFLAKR